MRLPRRVVLAAPMLLAAPARTQPAAFDASRVLAEAAALPRLRTVLVARSGATLFEKALRGPGLDRPQNIKSASKSVIAALVGIAIGRGVLRGLDQRVAPLLGNRLPREADPRVADITIEHLLSMRAGLERTSGANYGAMAGSRDWVRHILTQPMVDVPGGAMLYSTGSTHLLSVALTRASGRSTHALAREWLGTPLGIEIPPWTRDPQGVFFGGNEMALTPRALLRFGELYRNDGMHEGRRVLPEGWVQASWVSRARSPWSGMGYGLGWFVATAGFRRLAMAWGYGGQMLYVVPSLGVTVAMTSDPDAPRDSDHQAALHALLTGAILPAIERGA